ncbi:MAG: hypothetical protein ACLT9P_03580 [Evtepia gabavorous]
MLLGLTGLSVAGAVIVSTCTLCYAVSTDGSPPLAYVQGEDTHQTAVRQVEDQVSEDSPVGLPLRPGDHHGPDHRPQEQPPDL